MLHLFFDVTRNLVVLIIVASIFELLLPRSSFRPFLNTVVGLVLMVTLLSPLWSVLQIPGNLDPVIVERVALAEADVADKLSLIEQMNYGLTLDRYRELLAAKIKETLREEGMEATMLEITLQEDPTHPEFGRPRTILALVRLAREEQNVSGGIAPVRIALGGKEGAGEEEWVPGRYLSRRLSSVLGVAEGKIEVRVLKH